MAFVGQKQFAHEQPFSIGILLINLGTPSAPTTSAVRRYLAEFLSDKRVIELPRWLWKLILHGIILRLRPARSARAYRRVWTQEGSPLMVHSQSLALAVEQELRSSGRANFSVELAMCYGGNAISTAIAKLQNAGAQKLLVLPLYPQYSATTTAAALDQVFLYLQSLRLQPELRVIRDYYQDDGWSAAIADSISHHWQQNGRAEHLLFSFHGIPERYFKAGDPYFCHVHGSVKRIANKLDLNPSDYSLSFQSRVGREEWLKPYTDHLLVQIAKRGVKTIDVVCPGFAVDCLETIDEIAIENAETFVHAGGAALRYIPALNATASHVSVLTALVHKHAQGWEYDSLKLQELASQRASDFQVVKTQMKV
jgi:protoporphyrin/coproporphyrin ferrochelatase